MHDDTAESGLCPKDRPDTGRPVCTYALVLRVQISSAEYIRTRLCLQSKTCNPQKQTDMRTSRQATPDLGPTRSRDSARHVKEMVTRVMRYDSAWVVLVRDHRSMIKSSLVGEQAARGGIEGGVEDRGTANTDTNTQWPSGQTWTTAG